MITFNSRVCRLLWRTLSRGLNGPCCKSLTSTNQKSTACQDKAEPVKLKKQERYFEKRLRSVYQRFANVPDRAVYHGRSYVYLVEEAGVYRKRHDEDEKDAVQVLSADWAGDIDGTIQKVRLSPSESIVAATVKNSFSEEARCVLVQLHVAAPRGPMLILDNIFSFEWATDDVLFYTSQESLRCRHVFRLHFTDTGAHSSLIYEEKDPEFFVEVIQSRDQRLLTINCNSKSSSEVWVIDTKFPLSPPKLVQPRQHGLLYHVEHSNAKLYILANTHTGYEYQMLKTHLSSPAMQFWETVFSPGPDEVIKDLEMLQNYCVFIMRAASGQLQLQSVRLKTQNKVSIHQLPSWVCAIETERTGIVNKDEVSFLLSSPVHPPIRYTLSLMDEQPLYYEDILQHRCFPECHTTCLQVLSQDGTGVPLTLFHKQPLAHLGKAPLLLHVYGAYGLDLNMAFSPEKRLLLEDGWVLAYCHVRGGGERGQAWHRAGRLQFKQNGVDDLFACIQTLFQLGVSQPTKTALTAHSAGAVLAGALCNQHPHLLKAVLLQAPFLDVLDTMQDLTLPLTLEERGEWGDPLTYPQHRDNIASYCPCHNITPQRYPSMMITAYSGDIRVPLSGVLKYVERLKKAIHSHTSSCSTKGFVPAVRLDLQPGGDHFGPQAFHQSLRECARQLTFLYTTLELDVHGARQKKRQRRRNEIASEL